MALGRCLLISHFGVRLAGGQLGKECLAARFASLLPLHSCTLQRRLYGLLWLMCLTACRRHEAVAQYWATSLHL